MAEHSGESPLAKILGDAGRKAHEAHKNDETQFGMISLPAGISGGVAQLTKAYWARYKEGTKLAGKPYVRLEFRAVLPREHGGVPVAGQIVSQMISLCDTPDRQIKVSDKVSRPRTFKDNYADFLNELRKLGVDTSRTTFETIESTLVALQSMNPKPYTRFSTRGWTPPKTPQNQNPKEMVFTQLDGLCDFSDNGEYAASKTEDASGETDRKSEQKQEPFNEFADGSQSQELEESPTGLSDDPRELASQAADNEDAQNKLRNLALAAGHSEEEVDGADSWEQVAEMITASAAPPAEEEKKDPSKGEIYFFRPVDAKTGKPVKRVVEAEVTVVDKKSKTVTLKDIVNPKLTYSKVAWDALHETKETA